MRRLPIHHENRQSLAGILFFAQTMEEMLFEHSDDSYKAPALSTPSRIVELKKLVDDSIRNGLGLERLKPFVDELRWSINRELVLGASEKSFTLELVSQCFGDSAKPEIFASKLTAIESIFSNYFEQLKDHLANELEATTFSKKEIYAFAAQFISHAEFLGYNRRYTYMVVKTQLADALNKPEKTTAKALVNAFLEKFKLAKREWDAYIPVSKELQEKSHDVGFKMKFTDKLPETTFKSVAEYSSKNKPHQIYLILEKIEALDAHSAQTTALGILELIVSSITFCFHDLSLQFEEHMALYDQTTNFWIVVDSPPNVMLLGRRVDGLSGKKSFENVGKLLFTEHLDWSVSRRLSNALEYHRAAMISRKPENQLVDLWACLEGILPAPEANSSRINFFCGTLSAALTLTYQEKIFRVLTKDFEHEPHGIKKIIQSIGGADDSFFSKVVAITTANEFADQREAIAKIIGPENPLLLYRFYCLYENYKSKKHIRQTLVAHQEKVKWHIHRIYYARNSIVHSASALPYLGMLVDNLHTYVDTLLSSIVRVCWNSGDLTSIENAVTMLVTHERFLLNCLTVTDKSPDEICNVDNYWGLIFGELNPLRPVKKE